MSLFELAEPGRELLAEAAVRGEEREHERFATVVLDTAHGSVETGKREDRGLFTQWQTVLLRRLREIRT